MVPFSQEPKRVSNVRCPLPYVVVAVSPCSISFSSFFVVLVLRLVWLLFPPSRVTTDNLIRSCTNMCRAGEPASHRIFPSTVRPARKTLIATMETAAPSILAIAIINAQTHYLKIAAETSFVKLERQIAVIAVPLQSKLLTVRFVVSHMGSCLMWKQYLT